MPAFRVLVIDDHPMNRLIGAEIFQYLGCAVETAQDARTGLARLAEGAFDLVCLDRHMPDVGGDDLVQDLPPGQFVLAWSTDTGNLPARFDGQMSKPITIQAASEAIVAATRAAKERAGFTAQTAAPSAPVPTGSLRRSCA